MPLLQSDFIVCKPWRTTYTQYGLGLRELTKIGRPWLEPAGYVFDATFGSSWRNTLASETLDTLAITTTDDYELFYDGDGSDRVTYNQFVDYHKIYIINDGAENLWDSRIALTTETRVYNDDAPAYWKTYLALGLSDESDYSEVSVAASNDYYSDQTVVGFPRTNFTTADSTADILDTKVAKEIIWTAETSAAAPYAHPRGAHKLIRNITADSDLYGVRKYLKVTATNIATVLAAVDIYVFGEVNKTLAVGKAIAGGTIMDAITPANNVSFHKIYGWFCVTAGSTIECWNDFDRDTLETPPQDVTLEWVEVGESTYADWSIIPTTSAFSLTFFDEELIDYNLAQYLLCSISPYTSDFSDSTDMWHTMNNTTNLTALVDQDGTFTVNPSDSTEGWVEWDSPDSAVPATVDIGDHIVGIDDEGVLYNLGYITDIGESPNYQTITVASFEDNASDFTSGTVRVFSTKYGRMGFWWRREITCDNEALPITDLDVSWNFYGSPSSS